MTTNNYTGNKPQNISQIASKVVNFSVAANEWKKGQDGNKRQVTDWHNIKICDGLADFAPKYLD